MPQTKTAPAKKTNTTDRSTKLCARDVMAKDPVTISAADKLRDAMSLMVANHVTGLPVVDRLGHCVGVVSMMDLLSYEQDHAETPPEASEVETTPFFDQESQQWEDVPVMAYALEQFGEVAVNEVMTAEVISVRPDDSVRTVAQRMVDESVHRVMVLDQRKSLQGSISAIDIVRLVAEGDL